MKLLSVLGARPQFIKMAALNGALAKNSNIQSLIVHTGQHYDYNMSEVFFTEMNIPSPSYNLNINRLDRDQFLYLATDQLTEVFSVEKPNMVLVFGDTNSTLAGALAADKLKIPIAHIESGLRSHNDQMPEEINRKLTDQISDLLFVPAVSAERNLRKEKLKNNHQIINSGDIMLDIFNSYNQKLNVDIPRLQRPEKFILCTLHREMLVENYELLAQVITALNEINDSIPVILVAHPRTFKAITTLSVSSTFMIVQPQSYLSMLSLLKDCSLVMTDSGGLQKEAYFSQKPCIIIREETEWTELVDEKVSYISGFNSEDIIKAYKLMTEKPIIFPKGIYGNGNAANIITDAILTYFK